MSMVSEWTMLHPAASLAALGYLPSFLHESDPRPAKEQFDDNYRQNGGWVPIKGFKLNLRNMSIAYPGDPPLHPYASATLRDETIYVYPHSWVLILQPDRSYEIARMD